MSGLFGGGVNWWDEITDRSERLGKSGGLSMFQDLKTDFGSNNPASSTYANDTFAALTRERWGDYVKTFVPIENQLIQYATDPNTVKNAMSNASENVSDAYGAQEGAMQRRLSGLGVSLTPEEQAASAKTLSLSHATSDVQAQNLARDATIQRQQSILGNPAPDVVRAGSSATGG